MSTGWWGIPGKCNNSSATKVHFTLDTDKPKPICGSRLGQQMEYQFCAPGFADNYVECERCRKIALTKV